MDTAIKYPYVGYKQTELGEIPVEWEIKTLGEIGDFRKGKGIAKKDLTTDGHLCVLYGELYTRYSETISTVLSKTNIDPEKLVKGYRNDVLIPSSGETAYDIACASTLLVDDVLIGGDTNIFRPKECVNGTYLSYSINSILKNRLSKLAQGSSVYHLYSEPLSKFSVILPSLKEQQKIVEILLAADEQIEDTEQLIQKTKELKKGLMQQLLTKGIGHTDFKKTELGEIPVTWSVCLLKDITLKVTIGLVTTMTKFYVESGVPLIRNSDIKEGYVRKEELINLDKDFAKKHKSKRLLEKDIVTVHTGDIGTSAIIDKQLEGAHGFATLNTTVQEDKILPEYLMKYFNSIVAKNQFYNFSTGDGRNNLNLKDFVKTKVVVPASLEEQQKIVDILSTVDEQLEAYEQEKAKQIELKKGLMQQLLTGKVRVTV